MRTRDKLAAAIRTEVEKRKLGGSNIRFMIRRAEEGYYDDFGGFIATPQVALIKDANAYGLRDVESAARGGMFMATKEEADAWAEQAKHDPRVGPVIEKLLKAQKRGS